MTIKKYSAIEIVKATLLLSLMGGVVLFFACGDKGAADSEYVQNVELRLAEMEDTIIELRERADNPLTRNPEEFKAQIDTLSKMQERLADTLSRLKQQNAGLEEFKTQLEPMLKRWDKEYETARDW